MIYMTVLKAQDLKAKVDFIYQIKGLAGSKRNALDDTEEPTEALRQQKPQG